MSASEVKKLVPASWAEKEHPCLPIHYVSCLKEVEECLKKIEEVLAEAGIDGPGYQSQGEEIEKIGLGMGRLNAYISSAEGRIKQAVDRPLYQGFQNDAAMRLSYIQLDGYTTENTLDIKRHQELDTGRGLPVIFNTTAGTLSMKDFLGVTGIYTGERDGNLSGAPEEFLKFTGLFAADYDKIKENLEEEAGRPVSLEEYLKELNVYGEFGNEMDKPGAKLVSSLLDVTVIKPLIDACTGEDVITHERLSGQERGRKAAYAFLDALTLASGIKASGVGKIFSREALAFTGKTVAVDLAANGTVYGVGKAGEALGLPLPVTLLVSLSAGMTVSLKGGKYAFKDRSGNVLLEAAESEVKALEGGKGSGKVWNYSKQFEGELANFNDEYEIKHVVDKDMYLVQFHSDAEVGNGRSLKYWTTFDEANGISTIDDYMDKMALMSNWGARDNVSIAKIPDGTEIKYAVGTTRKQIGAIESRPGGGLQLLFEQFDDSWVLETRPMP